MDIRAVLASLLALSVALAGCSGDEDKGPSPEELCEGIWMADTSECVPHTEPHVVIEGLAPEITAYKNTAFTWRLDNGTRGEAANPVHSMDSRLLIVTDGSAPTNTSTPDDFGTQIAQAEHKNLPDSFDASFRWDTPGQTLAIWGVMRIDGVHVWNLVQNVTVVEPTPTGTTKTITFSGTPASASPSEQSGVVGDALVFDNQNSVYGYTISFECSGGVTVADVSVGAGASSAPVVFLKPTSCTWNAATQASGMGVTQGDLSGSYRANAE